MIGTSAVVCHWLSQCEVFTNPQPKSAREEAVRKTIPRTRSCASGFDWAKQRNIKIWRRVCI
jgi:hypothetical protein